MSACRRMQIFITLCKTQVKVDQRSPHKNKCTETDRRVRKNLDCIDTKDNFLNRTPIVQALKGATNKWELINMKNFYLVKNTANRAKWQSTEWGMIFTRYSSDLMKIN